LQKAIRTDTSNMLNFQHHLSSCLISSVDQGPPQGSCNSTASRDLHLGDKHCPARSPSLLGEAQLGWTQTQLCGLGALLACKALPMEECRAGRAALPFSLYLDAMMSLRPPVLRQHSWSWLCNTA